MQPASFRAESATGEPRYVFPTLLCVQRALDETVGFVFVESGRILSVEPGDGPAGPDFAWIEIEWPDGTRESIAVDGDDWDTAAGHRTL